MSSIHKMVCQGFTATDCDGNELLDGSGPIMPLGKLGEEIPTRGITLGFKQDAIDSLLKVPEVLDVDQFHQGQMVTLGAFHRVKPREIQEPQVRCGNKIYSLPTKGKNAFDVVVLCNDGSFVWVQNSIQTQNHFSGDCSSLNNLFGLSQKMFEGRVVSHDGSYLILPTDDKFAFQMSERLWAKNSEIEQSIFDSIRLYNVQVPELEDILGTIPSWSQYQITQSYKKRSNDYTGDNQVYCQVIGVNWSSNLCFVEVLHGPFHRQLALVPFHNINMKIQRGERFKTFDLGQLILAKGQYDFQQRKHTGPGVFSDGETLLAYNCREVTFLTKKDNVCFLNSFLESKGLSAPQQSLSGKTWWDDCDLKPHVK